eukprot:COSAG02_NODE_1810_length_10825_cov_43.150848_1_plen_701_part_00
MRKEREWQAAEANPGMRRLRGDYDPNAGVNGAGERGDGNAERDHQGLIITDSSGAPRQLLMISRNAPPSGLLNRGSGGGRLAMSSGLFGSGGRRHLGGLLGAGAGTGGENDPWATFWASMLASIIVSTDEELAQSLITMFGSDGPPEPPPPETLTADQFDTLEEVEYAASPDAVHATPLGKGGRPRVSEPDSCPICMCDYTDGMPLTRLPCSANHVFHEDCLRTWLLNKSTNCPMCRCDCRPKAAPEPARVEDPESLTADIDTAFNAVVEAADRARDPLTEPVPIRTNHNPRGRGLLRSSELASSLDARPSSVSRLRRQVTVGRYAEHFLGDVEDGDDGENQDAPTTPSRPAASVPASPASAAPSSPTSAPTSPAQTSDSELPADIVEMEDRMAAARSRRAQGAAREAVARRAESNMAAAQEALRARRQAARERGGQAEGAAPDSEREMSDWYRNHRTASRTRAGEVAALMDAEAPAAARWSATSTPVPAVVHVESQTSTLPTLSGPGVSAAPGTRAERPPIPPRQLESLLNSRPGSSNGSTLGVPGEPADLSSATDAMSSTVTGRRSSMSLTQRWLSRGRTVGGRSEAATAQIESAVSQLPDARIQATAARRSSAASSRRSAAALNESMRAAAAAENPARRTRPVSRGEAVSSAETSSASAASSATTRTTGPRGAGRMRRLMREARDLEGGGARGGSGS